MGAYLLFIYHYCLAFYPDENTFDLLDNYLVGDLPDNCQEYPSTCLIPLTMHLITVRLLIAKIISLSHDNNRTVIYLLNPPEHLK